MIQRNLFKRAKIEQHEKKSQPLSKSDAKPYPKLITDQSSDTVGIGASFLEVKDLASVSKTCRDSRALFSKPLSKRALKKLLQHVALGEQDQAKAIIKDHPELLLQADTVIDLSGRTLLNATPITAAYGADDVEMCEMMFEYLDKDSRDKAIHHIKETFPDEKSVSYDFSHIVAAITANKNVESTLEQFRKDFTPGVIKKGKHFNMKILLDAYQAYNDNWDTWSGEQCSLFFRQVIGYLQRLLPACYAQAFCQGLYNVTEGGKALQRGLKLDGGVPFYPPDLKLKSGLGFDYGVYSFYAGEGARGEWWPSVAGERGGAWIFEKLCRAKTSSLHELMQHPDKRAKQACAMM